jgi:hypothetical protein
MGIQASLNKCKWGGGYCKLIFTFKHQHDAGHGEREAMTSTRNADGTPHIAATRDRAHGHAVRPRQSGPQDSDRS